MAIDSAAKRFSMFGLALLAVRRLPIPSAGNMGTAAKRQHMNGLYVGIASAPPVTPTGHIGSQYRWGYRITWYY